MRRLFYVWVAAFAFCSSGHIWANDVEHLSTKNYVYDDEGNPVFIKIYIKASKNVSSSQRNRTLPSLLEEDKKFWALMTQKDDRGTYIVIPIKKKKSSSDDESTWECPYCHRENPASSNFCKTKGCVLHRGY